MKSSSAPVAHVEEQQPSKLLVAGSSPAGGISKSNTPRGNITLRARGFQPLGELRRNQGAGSPLSASVELRGDQCAKSTSVAKCEENRESRCGPCAGKGLLAPWRITEKPRGWKPLVRKCGVARRSMRQKHIGRKVRREPGTAMRSLCGQGALAPWRITEKPRGWKPLVRKAWSCAVARGMVLVAPRTTASN